MAGLKLHEFAFNLKPRDKELALPLLVSIDSENGIASLTLRTEKDPVGVKILIHENQYDEINDFLNTLSDDVMAKAAR